MCQKQTILIGRPLQDHFVVTPCQADILRPDNVEVLVLPEQRPQNVVVEVFICEPSQHNYCGRRACSRERIPSGRQRHSFEALTSSALRLRWAK
jgi:hypothetical protein